MLTLKSPAPLHDFSGLAFPGGWCGRAHFKAMMLQLSISDSVAFYSGATCVLIVGFWPLPEEVEGERLLEMWVLVTVASVPFLQGLRKLCRLTLQRLGDAGRVRIRAHVRPAHRPGQRLARMIGLQFAGLNNGLERWEWSHG